MPILQAERTTLNFGMTITDLTGNTMQIDIPLAQGGKGQGMRPMQTLLAALCGCSAVDVISILQKQKQLLNGFKIFVDGELEDDKEPSVWKTVDLKFELQGNIDASKAYRAVKLSIEKYCSVAETLRRAGAEIKFKVMLNDTLIDE